MPVSKSFLLLLYAAQVGRAFLPAPQRTGLEACPYLCRTRYTDWRNALSRFLAYGFPDPVEVVGRAVDDGQGDHLRHGVAVQLLDLDS